MSLGIWQILLIVLLVLLLFGAGKLPHVMGDLAKGVKNFKKGLDDDDVDDGVTSSSATAKTRAESKPKPKPKAKIATKPKK
jgi:sec-independent protein translocase protein TatA